MQSSLTVIIPALNEMGNLAKTAEEIIPTLIRQFKDYEIIIFNDGSQDQTAEIANDLASKNNKIKVIHNSTTMGLGYNYKKGVKMAVMDYIIMIPGDNDILKESLEEMFKKIGEKDILIPYTANLEIRPKVRQFLSKTFTITMNFLFGLSLKYFNGAVIHKRTLIQSVNIQTDSFAYQAEALIKLIKSGHSYEHVIQLIREREYGTSKALYPKSIIRVLSAVIQLFYEIHFHKSRWMHS